MAGKLSERAAIIRSAVLAVLHDHGDWLPSTTLVERVSSRLEDVDLPADSAGMRALASGEVRGQAKGLAELGLIDQVKAKGKHSRKLEDQARWRVKPP